MVGVCAELIFVNITAIFNSFKGENNIKAGMCICACFYVVVSQFIC